MAKKKKKKAPAAPAPSTFDAARFREGEEESMAGFPESPATPAVDEQTQQAAKAEQAPEPAYSIATDPYYIRDPKTGLSPAQVEARKGLEEAVASLNATGQPAVLVTEPGSTGEISTPPTEGLKPGYEWYAVKRGGEVEWRQRPTRGTLTSAYSTLFGAGSTGGTGATGGTGNVGTAGTTGAGTANVPTGPTLASDTFKNTLALFFGQAEAAKPWANALYNVVSRYFRTGSSADESFNLALQEARTNPELKPFADRFKGIFALQDMRQQGKPVLVPTIGEYVTSQAKMSDILTDAGLGGLANEEFTGDLIGKGNSVSTIANKIAQAFTRIDLAPKAIKDTLSRFYPTVDRSTLARTILLGEKGAQELVDDLAQYEVLAAAEQQGLGAIQRVGGLTAERAKEIARMGGTFQSTLGKFGQIAGAMPEVSKLAGISGRADIGQVGLEKAVIAQSQKELSELEKLSLEEEARFRGRTGRAELGLASQRRANRAF